MEVGVGDPGADLRLSVSQIQKFTGCENKWFLHKTLPDDQKQFAKSEALELGTLWHSLMAAWRTGKPWRDVWLAGVIESLGTVDVGYKIVDGEVIEQSGWQAPKIFTRALPIMLAWERVHGRGMAEDPDPEMLGAELVAVELPFDLPIPGVPDARIRGFIDGLVSSPSADGIRVHDRLRIVEDKTMGRWGRENQVPFDLQLNVYLWAARQMFKVDGAVFEAASTYAYKAPEGQGIEAVDDKRFKRLFLDYDQRLVDRTMEDVKRAAKRMRSILKNPGLIVRNVGDSCTYCDYRTQCLTPWDV